MIDDCLMNVVLILLFNRPSPSNHQLFYPRPTRGQTTYISYIYFYPTGLRFLGSNEEHEEEMEGRSIQAGKDLWRYSISWAGVVTT